MQKISFLSVFLTLSAFMNAQSFTHISSTADKMWQESTVRMEKKQSSVPVFEISGQEHLLTFKAWGGTFNELGWDALNMLPRKQQQTILSQLFSPDDALKLSLGRFSMNANDYARDWYSCTEVDGDFQLKHFNINRDKTTLIPFIKAAQEFNPGLRFWVSPWSPPAWMKVNKYYSVVSNKEFNKLSPELDYILYEDKTERNDRLFPKQLAVNDYLIQDPRYLQAYANYFSKFITAYKEEGIPVSMVMFQNEAWSYTPYPGCAWTAEGIIRFNVEFLAPTLQKAHPDVKVYLGTINTNRYEVIDQVLSDPRMSHSIQGVGFQWEGGQILPRIREKYPDYKYVQTESECGWGSFDWKAAEHTFRLINHYLGNGCEEYTFWNAILADDGVSGWGWKQNSLIRVDSNTRTATYTPEYYAAMHYSHFITPGSQILAVRFNDKAHQMPVMIARNPQGKYIIIAGNFNSESKVLTLKIGAKFLNVTLKANSLNSFQMK
jgi:glucosylceramidase